MIEEKDLMKLQLILRSDYGDDLSLSEVRKIGERLIGLYKVVLSCEEHNYDKHYLFECRTKG